MTESSQVRTSCQSLQFLENEMVFFVLTKQGMENLLNQAGFASFHLWVNAGIMSGLELEKLRASGVEVTNFTRLIDLAAPNEIELAISIIKEHHPNKIVWIEHM